VLNLPGAWFATAIFALHPVHVESVAWISELKNTLSGALCLGAALAYLRYDQGRKRSAYVLALALFFVGLLTKTVIVTLPVVLLVVFWWKRGKLTWTHDVKPLIPFFVVAFAAGMVTVWVEQKFCAQPGEIFDFSLTERCLVAGRLFWFYLAKLFWPTNLTMIYSRWHVSQTVAWQYLFPLAALALFVSLWIVRGRSRGPFAAVLSFLLMLSPVLGFVNLSYFMSTPSPFHQSAIFRADHFQYLASIPIIAAVSAGAAWLWLRMRARYAPVVYGICLAMLVLLASLTYGQSRLYRDAETCFRAVIAQNPDSATAHNNLGGALLKRGSLDEAIAHCRKAVELEPGSSFAHFSLALALLQKGEEEEAITHLRKVLDVKPDHADACFALAKVLANRGQTEDAIDLYERALKIDPEFADARTNFGNLLLEKGDVDGAMVQYEKAAQWEPLNPTAHYNLAVGYLRKGESEEAIGEFETALGLRSDYPDANYFLANTLFERGQLEEAMTYWQRSVETEPDKAEAAARLAWIYATCSNARLRDGERAVKLAEHARQVGGANDPGLLRILAAAYAEGGRFAEAIETVQLGLNAARTQSAAGPLLEALQSDLQLYQQNMAVREPSR
jgi:protein O-mannosyl-transferase